MFYPGSAAALTRELRVLLERATPPAGPPPKAIIAPHAGYIYSGPVAASVYAPLASRRGIVRRVILLGPTHRVAVAGLALPAAGAFATPLGTAPVDGDAAATVAQLPQVAVSEEAHAFEHSLEVHLPFLQTVLADFTVLPLAVGRATAAQVADVLDRVWGGDETLLVVSSDLSHYLPYAAARATDEATARRILALDPRIDHREACGATPINGLLLAAGRHGLRARLVDLRNSGDTAGDKSRVVGYGAFTFSATGAGDAVH
jgi:hypothetical protein